MVVSCCAYNCSNTSDKNPGLIFHSFPDAEKDGERRLKWINAIKRKNWQPGKWSKLCSAHFIASDYDSPVICGNLRLKKNAVPSVFSYPDHLQPKRLSERRHRVRIMQNELEPDPEDRVLCETEEHNTVSFENQDRVISDGTPELGIDSVPVFPDKERSISGKSARFKRSFKLYNQAAWSNFSSSIDVNEGNVEVPNDCYINNENSFVPNEDSLSVYEAVEQDILSTFENKIITISDPEEVCSVGNVQVISFVSEDEWLSDDKPAPKRQKRVQLVKESETLASVTAETNSERLIPQVIDESKSASSKPSDHSSYLCSVEAIQKSQDLDRLSGIRVKRKALDNNPRYAGDIKTNRFTSADAGRKAVTVLKSIALHFKTRLKKMQRKNSQLLEKALSLQDKLIRLTEESIQ